jgi:hypothetical protein
MVATAKIVRRTFGALGAAAMLAFGGTASALFIYGNAAGSNNLHQIDPATGTVIKTCPMAKGNGRGIVVVGTTTYYTVANSNNVYKTDFATCADNGIAFAVAGATGLSTIAFDGANLWIGDYSGPNKAYLYTPTGTLLNTITLNNCTSFCDGLEFFNGKLISNDADGGANYSIYTLSGGAPTTANFIATGTFTTGIAFDGTDFFISAPTASPRAILKYSGTTGALLQTINLSTTDQIEDLSADYAIVIGPVASTNVPTLSEWSMILMSALLAISAFFFLRRQRR